MNALQVFFGGLGLLLAAYICWPAISSAASRVWSSIPKKTDTTTPTIPPALALDIDVTDLASLKIVQARFTRINCPEGVAACTTLFEHFFHGAK